MTVYVDDMYRHRISRVGRMRMSHMLADTSAELIEFAEKLGLNPAWIQYAGTPKEHYDVTKEVRARALKLGALPVTMKGAALIVRQKRKTVDPKIF